MKKHNYVYTIVRQTPDENGVRRGYIGVHCTDNLDDGYFGSGVYLTRAVKKYGQDDFVKTIVADFTTEEEAVAYETELLHKMHKLSGGWELFSERFYNLTLNESRGKVSLSEETRKKMSEAVAGEKHPNFGKSLSEETKKKMSQAQSGEKNPMFGRTFPGEKHNLFKGFTIGTSLTDGKIIIFNGKASMKARGFSSGCISDVLSGKRPHHKNFTFTRTKDPEILKNLLEQNNFFDEESKIILEEFLRKQLNTIL